VTVSQVVDRTGAREGILRSTVETSGARFRGRERAHDRTTAVGI